MTTTKSRFDMGNVYLASSALCAVVFSGLFYYRMDICNTAFPLAISVVGLPLIGMALGGWSFLFETKSGWVMILAKIGALCINFGQFGMGLLSLTGLGLVHCS